MQLNHNLTTNTTYPYDSDRSQHAKNDWQQLQITHRINDDVPPHQQQFGTTYQQNYVVQQEVILEEKRTGCLAHLCNGSLEAGARVNFIKKIYMLLSLQLLITVVMCFISYHAHGFLKFQLDNYWLMWVCFGLLIVTEITILCCDAGRTYPINMILLLVFTLAEAYMVSFITSIVAEAKGGAIVVIAACMTLAIVIGLSLYAIFTRTDFTTLRGMLIAIIAPLILFGIFAWISWIPVLHSLYCALGAALFGIYLVIDTQLIVDGGRYSLSLDDYVTGALILYIDIIQIFLYILSLFGNS